MATEKPNGNGAEETPAELQPTLILMSIMVKIKVAPIVDEDDQELIVEKLSEILSDDNFSDVVAAYLADEENQKQHELEDTDVELLNESVVYEVSG